MNPDDIEFTSGYVGSMGMVYETPVNVETLQNMIESAVRFNGISEEEIIAQLYDGQSVKWQKSPNYTYDHSYGVIRMKGKHVTSVLVMCDCGHDVPMGLRMHASFGTACPDCYDAMSDNY